MQQANDGRSRNGTIVTPTVGGDRSIFRAQARRQEQQGQVTVVMPRLVSQRAFGVLWLLAVLLMVAGCLVAFWPVISPLFASFL